MRVAVVIIALVVGGWLACDGMRALLKGDYVTSRTGELGPWARLVSSIGVNPRGSGMKWLHVVLGLAWLGSAGLLLASAAAGRTGLLACSVLTLWYLPLGTVLSVVELILLLLPTLLARR